MSRQIPAFGFSLNGEATYRSLSTGNESSLAVSAFASGNRVIIINFFQQNTVR
jgi:hypothetical protein